MSPGIILNLQNKQIKVLFGFLNSSLAVSYLSIISTPITALAESVQETGVRQKSMASIGTATCINAFTKIQTNIASANRAKTVLSKKRPTVTLKKLLKAPVNQRIKGNSKRVLTALKSLEHIVLDEGG